LGARARLRDDHGQPAPPGEKWGETGELGVGNGG